MAKPVPDEYVATLLTIKGLANRLWGGYYEPKSERDIRLAKELETLVGRHTFCPDEPDLKD